MCRSPRLPAHLVIGNEFNRVQVSDRAEMEAEVFESIRQLDLQSKLHDKILFDAKAKKPVYKVGATVGLLMNISTGKLDVHNKLQGPFKVVSQVSEVTYRIDPVGFA